MKRTVSVLIILGLLLTGTATAFAMPVPSAVYELYSAEGTYTDEVGNAESYSYHVPQISADTPDAGEINTEIEKKYGELVEEHFHYMDEGLSLWCRNAGWQAFWNGSQLFLLLSADTPNDQIEYAAYGYDFDTGARITNKRILQQCGISEEEYLENLKEAARSMFVKINSGIPEDKLAESDYDALMERTLQWQTMDQPMYIDQDGEIATIAEIGLFAGAGICQKPVRPFEHSIHITGDRFLIESCPETAKTGETVTILTYDVTDGDKYITISGVEVVSVDWFEYQFIMPPHDVEVQAEFIGNGLA